MAYVTTEERVDRLEAVFGHFMTEMALLNHRAEERMARFETEMRTFKDEMRVSKKELNQKWGDLANKLGTIVEDIVAPNLRRLALDHFAFPVIEDFMIRRSRRRGGRETEFDTIVVGPAAVILGEARPSPSLAFADEFAAKAGLFFEFFPEYQGRRLIPVAGSWSMPDPVIERLTVLGVYAMRMDEDTMELANAAVLERS